MPVLVAAIVGVAATGAGTVVYRLGDSGAFDPAPIAMANTGSLMEDEVVDLMNKQRAEAGCDPVVVDPRLVQAAEEHSKDMAERKYFGHTTPEGLTFRDRILSTGYANPQTAENIARGQRDATQVMDSWMDSPGHRANILNCDLSRVGVGLDENGMYWTQDFGTV
ncbi:MAG TPA: CAP domain-containing protein [Actinophytocola sp.]|jgi:uncharacterized protein YkwD|nr:CAP domain-containing protein [Actinophytocola sp.]